MPGENDWCEGVETAVAPTLVEEDTAVNKRNRMEQKMKEIKDKNGNTILDKQMLVIFLIFAVVAIGLAMAGSALF